MNRSPKKDCGTRFFGKRSGKRRGEQKKSQQNHFTGSVETALGEVDVNYPNTVFPVKDGFGFVIRLKNL